MARHASALIDNTRTGTIDSGDKPEIAMWLLDTDYDGRSLYSGIESLKVVEMKFDQVRERPNA
jgi:hypothetical protein